MNMENHGGSHETEHCDVDLAHGSCCSCDGHSHSHELSKKDNIMLAISGILFILALILNLSNKVEFSLLLVSYIIAGGGILLTAAKNIAKGQVFDEYFLMSIATLGAFIVGEYAEGAAVMIFYRIGEFFQGLAVDRSTRSIESLMDIRPDEANLIVDGNVERVAAQSIKVGDTILVKPGEKLALDGIIVEGTSHMDTSALTGESMPRTVVVGDKVLAGFVNSGGALTIEVTEEFGESTASKVIELMKNASEQKAPTEQFMTKFAAYYTPVVVLIALAMATLVPLITRSFAFSTWTYRALIFLVISCPCAIVVSIPLGFFAGMGSASRKGILVKGGNYLEALNDVDTVIFDKTGTLTKGTFEITKLSPIGDRTKDELLEYAAYGEALSNHPIAKSIKETFKGEIDESKVGDYEEVPGFGIKANYDGLEILTGNFALMEKENVKGVDSPIEDVEGTVVYVAVDSNYVGHIELADIIKEDSKKAIARLKEVGIFHTIMLTGDNEFTAKAVGEKLGIDRVYANLLPHEKLERLEEIEKERGDSGSVAFVGDGINDSPSIARAKVGVAMGGLGADAAIEAADVVLMTDQVSKMADAIGVARKTRKVVVQNVIFALGIKIAVLLLGAMGIATMWQAVFADVGVTVISVLNSMRILLDRD